MLSVVCAIYNEEQAIPRLLDALVEVLDRIDFGYEIVIVDDGSTDDSLARAKAAIGHIPHLRVVQLYRNYGQVAALSAGLSFARGDWIVMMDGDLQHDPQDIQRLVAEVANGHDLIATYRAYREETRLRLAVTWLGNRVNRYLLGVPVRDFGSAYRLFATRLLDIITDVFGYVRYNTPALYTNARSFIELPITQGRRPYGASKWNLAAFILFNLDFFLHSKKLIQLLLSLGIVGILVGGALYSLSLMGFAEPARAASAPISIAFTSFLVILLAVIWREVMQIQRHALGQPPFLVVGIWERSEDGVAKLDSGPEVRTANVPVRRMPRPADAR